MAVVKTKAVVVTIRPHISPRVGIVMEGKEIRMPRRKNWMGYTLQWGFFPIAIVLLILKLNKLALVASLFGLAYLINYAEDEISWSRKLTPPIPPKTDLRPYGS